jgi:pyridoxal phosphate enzyme (YggS family)
MAIAENIKTILSEIPSNVTLVAISKTKPLEAITEAYNSNHRIFGENKVQELTTKYEQLPKDIEWHLVGHLQTNKVKYIAPFVSLIHSVDSLSLLNEIDKQGKKNNRIIRCLLQIYIASEETKFGLSEDELNELVYSEAFRSLTNVSVCGLMGMATFTDNTNQIRKEFKSLYLIFQHLKATRYANNPEFKEISMGMSSDYRIAIEEGSTMVRIGSDIFGERNYKL